MVNYIIIFLTAMTPVFELRGSIPLGIVKFHLDPVGVYIISIIANFLPALFIIRYLDDIVECISRKIPLVKRLYNWYCERALRKFGKKYQNLGLLGLTLFVAIPLPMTGAWTGSLASFLLGFPERKSMLAVFAGVLIAGIVVTLATLGIIHVT